MTKNHHPDQVAAVTDLTAEIMKQEIDERISKIAKEFQDGFNFVSQHPQSVTVFGSTRFTEENQYYQKARTMAYRISTELGYTVTTGGGPGIMEAANRGAFEAGGNSLGLSIKLPKEQGTNSYVTQNLDFHYFFSRKVCLAFSAEAFLFFPGGFGTLDEFFEILTLVQTHKTKPAPLLLYGSGYWQPLDRFIKDELLERGTVSDRDTQLYQISDDEEFFLEQIKTAYENNNHGLN